MRVSLSIVKEGSILSFQGRRWTLIRRESQHAVVSMHVRQDDLPYITRLHYITIVVTAKKNVNEHLSENQSKG